MDNNNSELDPLEISKNNSNDSSSSGIESTIKNENNAEYEGQTLALNDSIASLQIMNSIDSDRIITQEPPLISSSANVPNSVESTSLVAVGSSEELIAGGVVFNESDIDSQIQSLLNINNNSNNIDEDDLPIFATPAARKIDQEIKEKGKKLDHLVTKISDIDERIQVMKEHYKNVEQEIEYTNSRLHAKNAEIETEKHLRELTSRELSRVKIKKSKVKEEAEILQDEINSLQRKISQSKDKMDEYIIQMNWSQEELQEFMIAEKQKEDDFLALQKYARADELKVKELTLQIENLTKQVLNAKDIQATKNSIYTSKQVEIKRIAEDCMNLHKERQYLVEQWEKSIVEMKRRDKEISELGQEYAIVKAEKIKKEQIVLEQKKRLQSQQADNRTVEARTETLSRLVMKKREDLLVQQTKLKDLKDELSSLKNELINTSEKIMQKKISNANKAQANEETKVQLERERANFQRVKELIDLANNSTIAIEEKAKRYEAELELREKEYEVKLMDIKRLRDVLFKENQFCFELDQEQTRIFLEISGNKSISKNYDGQLIQLDKEATRQQELLYDAEFQIQQIERKIAHGLGERSDEEKRKLNDQIAILEVKVIQVKENKKLIQNQLRKLNNEYLIAVSRKEDVNQENNELINKLTESELENRMIDEEIKRDRREKEEMLIQNDLLRLEVRKLRDSLASKTEAVYNLENRKQEILLSTDQKKQTRYTNRDILKAEIKILNDEKHKLTIELKNREMVVNNLRARFEVLSKPEDEAGHTHAHFVIMAAQKREELRRKGDDLDMEIQKGEKEIYALQLTLDHLNSRNNNFKSSLQTLDFKAAGGNDEIQQLKQLEQMIEIKRNELSRSKKESLRLTSDVEEDMAKLSHIQSNLANAMQQQQLIDADYRNLQDENTNLANQLNDIKLKIHKRVEKHRVVVSEREQMDVNSYNDTNGGTLAERAAKADVMRDVSQNVLFTLGQLAVEFPEITDVLNSRLQDYGLRIPSKLASSDSSSSSSHNNSRNKLTGGAAGLNNTAPIGGRDSSKFSAALRAKANSNKMNHTSAMPPRSSATTFDDNNKSREGSTVLKTKSFVPEFN